VPAPADDELRALVELIRDMRRERGVTQETVSLDGGYSRKYLGQVERREIVPKVTGVFGISRGLKGTSSPEFLRAWADYIERDRGGD
jgi:transcriptional regulator with XRE-family HTH domain